MREDAKNFTKDKYFNGYHKKRSVKQNWNLIKNFILESVKEHTPS